MVFGNDRPVEVEIGPGRGDVLVAFASARPDVNFFAVEHARGPAEAAARRLTHAAIPNARIVVGDARCIVHHCVPDASVAAYHVYFPDPWPKRRHGKRRLFDARFVADLRRTLRPGGAVHVATDLPALFETIAQALAASGFRARAAATAPQRPTTRFERKYAGDGTYAGTFVAPS